MTALKDSPQLATKRLLYNRKEAATLLNISLRKLDSLIADNRIRVRRLDGRVLFTPQALDRFVDGLAAGAPSEPFTAPP